MNITILTYLDSPDENSKDYDPVVPQVARTLRRLGHRVSILGVHGDVKRLVTGIARRKPDLVFNLMEMFGDNLFGEAAISLSDPGDSTDLYAEVSAATRSASTACWAASARQRFSSQASAAFPTTSQSQ